MIMDYCKISLKKLTGKQSRIGYHNAEFKNLFGSLKVNPCLPYSRSELFQESRQSTQGMSISGVQQKLSLKEDKRHEFVPTVEGGSYILKPSPETYPHAAENEHTAMIISRELGIETALCGLISFSDGELVYITKRFDRQTDGSKLHQEDLLQCFGLANADKYGKTYEAAGKLVQQVTNGKQAVVLDFVRRIIFAYAIGNDDLHLKNLSVQRLPDNKSQFYDKLTPNYDCLFCDAFKSDSDQNKGLGLLALGLLQDADDDDEFFSEQYNHYGFYTGSDFLQLALRLELPEKPVRTFIGKLKSSESKLIELINHSFMPPAMKSKASSKLKERNRALATGLD